MSRCEDFLGLCVSDGPWRTIPRWMKKASPSRLFRLIPAQRMLLEDAKPLRLGSRALDILVTLVENAGETIRKDQLLLAPFKAG
jgi:hypothetical protein